MGRSKRKIQNYNWKEIQKVHDQNTTLKDLIKKFDLSRKIIDSAEKEGLFIKRKFPRLHTKESKKKLSKKRKQYLKENPDKHPWKRNSKFKSEPCEHFKSILRDNNISFIDEFEPLENNFYSIDIAFPNEKIGIEINGNQHYDRDGNLKPYYKKRHDTIVNNGWKLFEIQYIRVYDKKFIKEFLDKIKTFDLENIDYSFIKRKKRKTDKKKCIDCDNLVYHTSTRCNKCASKRTRKVTRPSKKILLEDIKELGYCGTGRKYGVSDNAIRKWLK